MKIKKFFFPFGVAIVLSGTANATTTVPVFTSVADCMTWVGNYSNTIPTTLRSPPDNLYFHNFFQNYAYANYGGYSTQCATSNGSTTCTAQWFVDSHGRAAAGGCQFVGTSFYPQLNATLQMEVDNYESDPQLYSLPENDYGVTESYQPEQTPNINDGTLLTYQIFPGTAPK